MIERLQRNLTVLHPLPRVNEITADVDSLPKQPYAEFVAAEVARWAPIVKASGARIE